MEGFDISRHGADALRIRYAEDAGEEGLARCRGVLKQLEALALPGVKDITPAYLEVLIEFDDSQEVPGIQRRLAELLEPAMPLPPAAARLHEIPVRYDGEDLEHLARIKGLSKDDIVEIHSATVYNVYQIGFAPGFPYLEPVDPRLHTPRRDSPRVRVPAGSVAIGGAHTGIYSIASAGGWWLIGRTAAELFSLRQAEGEGSEEAFLIGQGDRVKFLPS